MKSISIEIDFLVFIYFWKKKENNLFNKFAFKFNEETDAWSDKNWSTINMDKVISSDHQIKIFYCLTAWQGKFEIL